MTNKEAIRRMEFCRNFLANNYSDMGEPNVTAFNMAIKALEQQPKTGHWILLANELYMCSECNAKWTMRLNYCPNCGARMAESEEEE